MNEWRVGPVIGAPRCRPITADLRYQRAVVLSYVWFLCRSDRIAPDKLNQRARTADNLSPCPD